MLLDDISSRIQLSRAKLEETRSAVFSHLCAEKQLAHDVQTVGAEPPSSIPSTRNVPRFRRGGVLDAKCAHACNFFDRFGQVQHKPQREQFRCEISRPTGGQWTQVEADRSREIEIFAEKCSNACNFWDSFGKGPHPREMVRVGEFSPQNPSLQTTGRSLLGLGEYEERRRLLLQRKRDEYAQEMAQVAQKSSMNQTTPPSNPQKTTRDCCTQTDLCLLVPGQPLSVDVQSSNSIEQKASVLLDLESASQAVSEMVESNLLYPPPPSVGSPDKRKNEFSVSEDVDINGALTEARLRQLRHQEDLRRQIEEKHRLEAERREKEAREEEALARRVAEQQARLQAEYEEEERLRRQKEREKQQQSEEFLRRQEQLLVESEQLKVEKRRKRMEALTALAEPPTLRPANPEHTFDEKAAPCQQQVGAAPKQLQAEDVKAAGSDRPGRNAHLVPPGPAAPISILKSSSPPPRSPREPALIRADMEPLEPPSPRALIKVLEGPTVRPRQSRSHVSLEDSLPIPLLRQTRTRTRTPSPCRRPTPQRFPPVHSRSNPNSAVIQPSEAMLRLEDKWKVPAVQKNVMTKRKAGQWGDSSGSHVVLTQLGSFRRQLQEEHMRMEEKVRDCAKQPVS